MPLIVEWNKALRLFELREKKDEKLKKNSSKACSTATFLKTLFDHTNLVCKKNMQWADTMEPNVWSCFTLMGQTNGLSSGSTESLIWESTGMWYCILIQENNRLFIDNSMSFRIVASFYKEMQEYVFSSKMCISS